MEDEGVAHDSWTSGRDIRATSTSSFGNFKLESIMAH
jgi:hypothetical protein